MNRLKLIDFFQKTESPRQKQYEAVRSVVIDNLSCADAAKKFGYKENSLYTLIKKTEAGNHCLFPEVPIGPQGRSTKIKTQNIIIQYRTEQNLSADDIKIKLNNKGTKISVRTIERILVDAGFKKLKRRTHQQRGVTLKNKIIPERSKSLDFDKLKPFKIDCSAAGLFLFLPYIIESDILNVIKKCALPKSSAINSLQACLSILVLKLLGNDRLSKVDDYNQEPGLAIFAGLNIFPKPTYMCTYSCRTTEKILLDFQKKIIKKFRKKYPEFYDGEFINLDFHSIPHYGTEAEMENVWCGAKSKTMKGANTIFAQDSKNKTILYSRADIFRREEAEEIKKFVDYWEKIKGKVTETLVFDCKLTKYSVLGELDEMDNKINFITLRKRNAGLLKKTEKISDDKWQKVKINIPKRKYSKVSVNESKVLLPKCEKEFRQIIIKDHGRQKPTFVITNNEELSINKILEVYAKRWRIENKFSELVEFFSLNSLSSPLMIRIHFDILMTFIADTLYHIFAKDLRRFEHHDAKTIFRKFINMPGHVDYDGERFLIKIRKRAYTPILKNVDKLNKPIKIPWLEGKTIQIIWTA